MASELKSAYLIAGNDEGKIASAIERLRGRAEREQGPGALERIPVKANGTPDLEALAGSVAAISLTATHRYILVEGAERIGAGEAKALAALLGGLGEDLTVVFAASGEAKAGLVKAVEAAEGDVLAYAAPKRRDLPRWLAEEARRRGFELAPAASKALVDRVGERTVRLASELERLASWAQPGERIDRDEIAASVADDSQEAIWALSDAIVDRRPDVACRAAERLLAQGEAIPPIVYGAARSLRNAVIAAEQLESGVQAREVEKGLAMHPYAARKLVQRVAGTSADELRGALIEIAELEWKTRGGSERDQRSTFVLGARAAAGAG